MRSCKMTKMHYQLIADTIAHMTVTSPTGAISCMSPRFKAIVAENFAQALRTTNEKFDEDRFLKACIMPTGTEPTGPKR